MPSGLDRLEKRLTPIEEATVRFQGTADCANCFAFVGGLSHDCCELDAIVLPAPKTLDF